MPQIHAGWRVKEKGAGELLESKISLRINVGTTYRIQWKGHSHSNLQKRHVSIFPCDTISNTSCIQRKDILSAYATGVHP